MTASGLWKSCILNIGNGKTAPRERPVLVTVRCRCGTEKTVLPATLTRTKHPLRSCGGKGCRTRRPSPNRKSGIASGEARRMAWWYNSVIFIILCALVSR